MFPKKQAYTTVFIFIEDTPSPPVLEDPSLLNLTVVDNTPAPQFVGLINVTNRGTASASLSLVPPVDGSAFTMNPDGSIYTTPTGAATINGLSTKTQYTLTVLASAPCPTCSPTVLTDTQTYTVMVKHTNSPPEFVAVSPFYLLQYAPDSSIVCFDTSGVCNPGKS